MRPVVLYAEKAFSEGVRFRDVSRRGPGAAGEVPVADLEGQLASDLDGSSEEVPGGSS